MKLSMPKQFTFIIVLFLAFSQATYSKTTHKQEAIKSAYIFNFLKYIEWPNESSLKQIKIAYIGNDQSYINELKKLEGKKFEGKQYQLVLAQI